MGSCTKECELRRENESLKKENAHLRLRLEQLNKEHANLRRQYHTQLMIDQSVGDWIGRLNIHIHMEDFNNVTRKWN